MTHFLSEPPYQPVSRRPIAGVFRATANATVALALRAGIHPDLISFASVVAATGAAGCFWRASEYPWLLLVGPLLCYVRLWMNMLDGMVALAGGKASRRGEILNDLPDRVSDVLIFAGVAHSGLNSPFPAYWAAIFALLTAYVGTLGQAVGVRREYSGMMSKPWRMVVLNVGAYVTFVLIMTNRNDRWGGLTVLDWTCVVIVAGCVQTIVVRLRRILGALGSER